MLSREGYNWEIPANLFLCVRYLEAIMKKMLLSLLFVGFGTAIFAPTPSLACHVGTSGGSSLIGCQDDIIIVGLCLDLRDPAWKISRAGFSAACGLSAEAYILCSDGTPVRVQAGDDIAFTCSNNTGGASEEGEPLYLTALARRETPLDIGLLECEEPEEPGTVIIRFVCEGIPNFFSQ